MVLHIDVSAGLRPRVKRLQGFGYANPAPALPRDLATALAPSWFDSLRLPALRLTLRRTAAPTRRQPTEAHLKTG